MEFPLNEPSTNFIEEVPFILYDVQIARFRRWFVIFEQEDTDNDATKKYWVEDATRRDIPKIVGFNSPFFGTNVCPNRHARTRSLGWPIACTVRDVNYFWAYEFADETGTAPQGEKGSEQFQK